jgi:hypothetical protein
MNVLEINFNIGNSLYSQLQSQALNAVYTCYVSQRNNSTQVQFSRIYDDPEIEQLAKQLPFPPFGFMFLKIGANAIVDLHVDDSKMRSSCLTIGLSPVFENMAPLEYYNSVTKPNHKTQTYFYNKNPVVINTQLPHTVVNNNFDRYTFQIMYSNSIEEFMPFAKSCGDLRASTKVE